MVSAGILLIKTFQTGSSSYIFKTYHEDGTGTRATFQESIIIFLSRGTAWFMQRASIYTRTASPPHFFPLCLLQSRPINLVSLILRYLPNGFEHDILVLILKFVHHPRFRSRNKTSISLSGSWNLSNLFEFCHPSLQRKGLKNFQLLSCGLFFQVPFRLTWESFYFLSWIFEPFF